jgi:hypothetical protein
VTAAMADVQFSSEGMVRMPVGKLLDVGDAKPLPLGGVGFLQPFADETRVEFVQAGREELSQMQPLASSFGGGAASSRVFGMIRLLGAVRCFRIWPSQPDRTAADLEEALR